MGLKVAINSWQKHVISIPLNFIFVHKSFNNNLTRTQSFTIYILLSSIKEETINTLLHGETNKYESIDEEKKKKEKKK